MYKSFGNKKIYSKKKLLYSITNTWGFVTNFIILTVVKSFSEFSEIPIFGLQQCVYVVTVI